MSRALTGPPAQDVRPSRSTECRERGADGDARPAAAGLQRASRPMRCRFRIPWQLRRLPARPEAARSRRPWRRLLFAPSDLDVEVADALGVRLNELLARLHVRSHQLLECVGDRI